MEIDYMKLYDLEETGEEVQEAAEPAEDVEAEGEEVQEVAEPAVEEPAEETEGEEEVSQPKEEKAEEKGKSDADRAAAARRRAKEREEAMNKVRQDAQKEADEYLSKSLKAFGIVDPYTKKPISTRAEMDAYLLRHAQEQKDRAMKKTGMSEEEFAEMVNASPQVQALNAAKEQAEQEARAAKEQNFLHTVEKELDAIRELYPTVKSVEDILKMETAAAFQENVEKGMNYVDAFKLANFDAIRDRAARLGKRDAVTREKGKEHLGRTDGRGAGAVTVPAEVREEYLLFNPNATEAEIQRHWAKYNK